MNPPCPECGAELKGQKSPLYCTWCGYQEDHDYSEWSRKERFKNKVSSKPISRYEIAKMS